MRAWFAVQPDRGRAIAPDGEAIHQRRPWPRAQAARRFRRHDHRASPQPSGCGAPRTSSAPFAPVDRPQQAGILAARRPRRRPRSPSPGIGRRRAGGPVLQPGSRVNFDAPVACCRYTVPCVRTPIRRASAETSRSGGRTSMARAARAQSPARRSAGAGSATGRARRCRARSTPAPRADVRHVDRRRRPCRGGARDPQDRLDAPAHRHQRQPLEPERHQHQRRSARPASPTARSAAPRPCWPARNRPGCGRNGRRRTAPTRCRPARWSAPAPPGADAKRRGQLPLPCSRAQRGPQHLVAGDQRQHGGKAHLEARRPAPPAARAASAPSRPAPGRAAKSPAGRRAPRRCNRHAMAKLRTIGTCMPVSTM